MAYTAQSASVNAASATTAGILTTTGQRVVAICAYFAGNTPAATPVSDSLGNTWTLVSAFVGGAAGNSAVGMYEARNITGGSGHTFTFSLTASGFPSIAVLYVDDTDVTIASDRAASTAATASGTSHASAATATTTIAAEVLVGGFTHNGGANQAITAGSGYTIPTNGKVESTTNTPIAVEWQAVAATGAYAAAFTTTGAAVVGAVDIGTFSTAVGPVDPGPSNANIYLTEPLYRR